MYVILIMNLYVKEMYWQAFSLVSKCTCHKLLPEERCVEDCLLIANLTNLTIL